MAIAMFPSAAMAAGGGAISLADGSWLLR